MKKQIKQRKEVQLEEGVITLLQSLADKKKWSLKQYMEEVLIKDSERAIK